MKPGKIFLLDHIFSSITHGIGALLSILALVLLLLLAKDGGVLKITSFAIFGSSLLLMYLMSTLFHGLFFTRAKKLFLIFDRASVFLLIAGTYTPLALLLLHGWVGISLMTLIWSLAICGIVLNAVAPDRQKLFTALFLLMGWVGVFLIHPLLTASSVQQVSLLMLGGILYTSGTVFHNWKKLPFNHTIWHFFVLAGSFCHFLIIYHL